MFNKINSKIKQIGFRKTIHLIIEKLIVKIRIDFNFTLNRKNPLKQEWIRYWKSYSFFERKYKNIILNMKKKEMTNQYSNKVWWCWLQGEENAPLLQQKCLESLRNNLKDREVIVITRFFLTFSLIFHFNPKQYLKPSLKQIQKSNLKLLNSYFLLLILEEAL